MGRTQSASAVPAVEGPAAGGQRLAPGTGVGGRLRDTVMRAFTARSGEGLRQRAAVRAEIGLPARDPGPVRRLIATLPALEVP